MAKSKSSQPKAAVKVEEQNDQQPTVNESENVVEQNADVVTAKSKSSQPKAADVVNIDTVTSTVISSSATPPVEDKTLVKVKISYPEDYSKKKFFQEGEIKAVSAESAEAFIASGIATKVE